MSLGLQAVAVDYDGTIADHDLPDQAALEAIGELRRAGWRVLLCTGRIVAELRAVFPDVEQHFDAIVAENGGIVGIGPHFVPTAEALPCELLEALQQAAVPVRAGHVLLATEASYDAVVLEQVARLGLEAQLVYNRGALMVLPAGVSKGTGVLHGLGLLEVSRHSTIAIGDAENDHSLLHVCEIGVAVGNAVPALRLHADLCLEQSNGAGVAAFLRDVVARPRLEVHPERWHVELGRTADCLPARMPAGRINVLIAGASGAGKSHLAGLLVEHLVELDYSICVFDAEGDHVPLDHMAGVIAIGGTEPLPPPDRISTLVRHRFSSVIADLSLLAPDQKRTYVAWALAALERLRRERGFPHWIVVEEADQLFPKDVLPWGDAAPPQGYCLVTHRPGAIVGSALSALDFDVVLALPGAEQYARVPFCAAQTPLDQPFQLETGWALLATSTGVSRFELGPRLLPHVRHQHKYTYAQVAPERRFFFGPSGGARAAAGNLVQFRCEVARAPAAMVRAHLRAGDFSRWIRDVLADDELGARLRNIERWFRTEPDADIDKARAAVIAAVEARYAPEPLSAGG